METMGLLIFLVLAISASSLAVNREYHHISEPKNWTDAQTYCREMFDDLVTIESDSDWVTVSNIIINSGHWAAWIGLYKDLHSWRWSLDNTYLNTTLDSWFNLVDGNTGSCLMLTGGSFQDKPCEEYHTYMCYDEPANSYIPFNSYESWVTAQTICRTTYTDLVSVRDQGELDTISGMVETWKTVWVGLSKESWSWSDQSESHFRLWMGGYPLAGGGNCVFAQENGWMDDTCAALHPFICSSVVPVRSWNAVKIGLKADETVDMSDMQIRGTALQQMVKELRAHDVQDELTLKWMEHPNGEVFNQTVL